MKKIYLEVGDKLSSVVGEYLTRDEENVYLRDGSVRREIPRSRIVHIEDLSEVFEEAEPVRVVVQPPAAVPQAPAPTPPPRSQPGKGKARLDPESLQKMLAKNVKRVAPDAKPMDPDIPKAMNVVMTGAVSKTISMNVSGGAIVGNIYTPSLSKEIASNMEIKSVMDSGIIFDGIPTVAGNNIYIKTRPLEEQIAKTMGSMGTMSKIASTVSKFTQPSKVFQNEFAMDAEPTDNFAITQSPFDGPIVLDDKPQPADELRITEEVNDAGSPEETTGSEETAESPVSEM